MRLLMGIVASVAAAVILCAGLPAAAEPTLAAVKKLGEAYATEMEAFDSSAIV